MVRPKLNFQGGRGINLVKEKEKVGERVIRGNGLKKGKKVITTRHCRRTRGSSMPVKPSRL